MIAELLLALSTIIYADFGPQGYAMILAFSPSVTLVGDIFEQNYLILLQALESHLTHFAKELELDIINTIQAITALRNLFRIINDTLTKAQSRYSPDAQNYLKQRHLPNGIYRFLLDEFMNSRCALGFTNTPCKVCIDYYLSKPITTCTQYRCEHISHHGFYIHFDDVDILALDSLHRGHPYPVNYLISDGYLSINDRNTMDLIAKYIDGYQQIQLSKDFKVEVVTAILREFEPNDQIRTDNIFQALHTFAYQFNGLSETTKSHIKCLSEQSVRANQLQAGTSA